MILLVEQVLNGVQLGVMLFLMAAGLTLVFGIMNLINLAHGSLYMVGAYVAAATLRRHRLVPARRSARRSRRRSRSALALEIVVFRTLYARDHLDQVLATFGLILFFNEVVRLLWGSTALYTRGAAISSTAGSSCCPGVPYPVYRLAIIARRPRGRAGLLYLLIVTHPARHADPRRRHQPGHGRRARRQYRGCSTRWSSASARRSRRSPG